MGVISSLATLDHSMVAVLLRKHGGKTGADLKTEEK
jgi:hypothetical protein